MAGIIGGTGEASTGKYKGIAPECTIISAKVLNSQGSGFSTVKRLHEGILIGRYKTIETSFRKEKDRECLLSQLEVLSRAGLPPYAGPRYKKKKSSVL